VFSDQTRTEMGTEEACPAGDQNTFFQVHSKILCCSRPLSEFALRTVQYYAAREEEHN
jgi:hypothetical protein